MIEDFGSILRTARLSMGLTQEKLAELANISGSQISRLENNVNSPSAKTIVKLNKVLHITLEEQAIPPASPKEVSLETLISLLRTVDEKHYDFLLKTIILCCGSR